MENSDPTQHTHHYSAGEWPFAAPSHATAFSTSRCIHEGWPFLMVYHDHEGDWQFHHGYLEDDDTCSVVCLGCVFDRDPSVAAVADLPIGWCATRESKDGPWSREAYDPQEDEDE